MAFPDSIYNEKFNDLVADIDPANFGSEVETQKIKDLKIFSEARPPAVEPTPLPEPVPTTWYGKAWVGCKRVAAHDNFGILVKSGLAAASVLGVTYATVKRDHVVEKQSMAQANQAPR